MFETWKNERLCGGSWIDITLENVENRFQSNWTWPDTFIPLPCFTYLPPCYQFRAAVVEAARRLNEKFSTSQISLANPLTPIEVIVWDISQMRTDLEVNYYSSVVLASEFQVLLYYPWFFNSSYAVMISTLTSFEDLHNINACLRPGKMNGYAEAPG